MKRTTVNLYDLSKAANDAETDEIKKLTENAASKHYPDKGGTNQFFQLIKVAWHHTLSNPIKKRNYDKDMKKYGSKIYLKSRQNLLKKM